MKSYRYAVAVIAIFLIIAHFVVGEPYLWYRNSISQLAAQAYPNAWIMRAGFISFGVLLQIAGIARMKVAGWRWYRDVPVMLYGLAILASGLFSAEPFIEGIPYSAQEAQIHGYLATAGGLFLTVGILLYLLTDTANPRKMIHTLALILTPGIAFSFFAMPAIGGLLQRLLWIVGFAWLVYLGDGGADGVASEPSSDLVMSHG